MHPYIIQWGQWSISTYGLMMAAAFLAVVWCTRLATRQARGRLGPMTEPEVVDWAVWALLGGIVGGRVLYVALNWPAYAWQPLEWVALWHGGLVWYGGFTGGVAATVWYLRARGHTVLRGLDQVIPFVALGHAIGRLGCFAHGCCAGTPTTAWWGIQFPGHADRLVPVQLIESAAVLGLFVLLRQRQSRKPLARPGALFGIYLVGYALIRVLVEQWRAHQPVVWGGVTLQQAISALLLAAGLALVLRRPSVSS